MFFRPMTNRRNEGRTVEPNCNLMGNSCRSPQIPRLDAGNRAAGRRADSLLTHIQYPNPLSCHGAGVEHG